MASTDIEAAHQQLQILSLGLNGLDGSPRGLQAFGEQARAAQALRQALPPRYAQVLDDLLTRLESSALFDEESCSFSQQGLIDSLRQWLDQAGAQLVRPPAAR